MRHEGQSFPVQVLSRRATLYDAMYFKLRERRMRIEDADLLLNPGRGGQTAERVDWGNLLCAENRFEKIVTG